MALGSCRAVIRTSRVRIIMLLLAVTGLVAGGLFAAARSSVAQASTAHARAAEASATHPGATAKAGTNLLLNPNATAGDTSAQGWDAVTIPGWQVQAGLPTVVTYGTPGFPKVPGKWPASRGDLFVGGDGGTASLVQVVRPGQVASGTKFTLGAWLGGNKTSDAGLKVRFLDASGRAISMATLGPVGRQASPALTHRTLTGTVPAGAVQSKVTLILAATLTDYNSPHAPPARP